MQAEEILDFLASNLGGDKAFSGQFKIKGIHCLDQFKDILDRKIAVFEVQLEGIQRNIERLEETKGSLALKVREFTAAQKQGASMGIQLKQTLKAYEATVSALARAAETYGTLSRSCDSYKLCCDKVLQLEAIGTADVTAKQVDSLNVTREEVITSTEELARALNDDGLVDGISFDNYDEESRLLELQRELASDIMPAPIEKPKPVKQRAPIQEAITKAIDKPAEPVKETTETQEALQPKAKSSKVVVRKRELISE